MRIAIVNDSIIAVESMRRILASAPEHSIIWVAGNGAEAVEFCRLQRPDLILMDLIMPVLDGVEATRRIMKSTPCPILIVTSTVSGHSAKVFEAMGAGALDAVKTPIYGRSDNAVGERTLLNKIGQINILTGNGPVHRRTETPPFAVETKGPASQECLLVIGSSTGGPNALVTVLSYLPKNFPCAVVVIQHMDTEFAPGMINWLNEQLELSVRMVHEGDRPQAGTILVPSTDGHVVLTAGGGLRYTPEPKEIVYHPSVDVFFHSVARYWKGNAIGVLLTGMGKDGAEGLLALRRRGWHTIAQDESTSVVYGMPRAAVELGAAKEVLPICNVGPNIIDLLAPKKRSIPYGNDHV